MSTVVDGSGSTSGAGTRVRWLLAALVVLAVAVLVIALRGGGSADPAAAPSPQAGVPEPLRAALAARLVTVLEEATPAEHHDHGHELAGPAPVICAVDVFGIDPPGATALDQVRTVYALHLCAVAEPGRPWEWAVKMSGPLAAQWRPDRPVVRIAAPGQGYPERVRALIPDRYQDRAFGSFQNSAALAELRRRFDTAIARPSASQ